MKNKGLILLPHKWLEEDLSNSAGYKIFGKIRLSLFKKK